MPFPLLGPSFFNSMFTQPKLYVCMPVAAFDTLACEIVVKGNATKDNPMGAVVGGRRLSTAGETLV